MYRVIHSKKFKKSLRKLNMSGRKNDLQKLKRVISFLSNNKRTVQVLSMNDHSLHGELSDYRECHVKSDLLLVYKKDEEKKILTLVDVGSHSELFD